MDAPNYGQFYTDDQIRAEFEAEGHDLDANLVADAEIDNLVYAGISGITRALHICRGNFRSHWVYEGSLEPLAERVFNDLPYDVFLVEWDDVAREGDYSSLRFLPAGRIVAMGIVSSKVAAVERVEHVLERLAQAGRHVDLDQLAVSTQCGFASVAAGNEISWDDQRRKLDLLVATARTAWPR
jgi:5-methyltetrahydropteroyltriglutamate--homocysteine methyltransferase